jgi:hypothetical protein
LLPHNDDDDDDDDDDTYTTTILRQTFIPLWGLVTTVNVPTECKTPIITFVLALGIAI